jgi:hypothetical protein
MAKSFLTPIDLNGLEILNSRLQNLASAPASPGLGRAYFDTTLGNARIYGSSGWVNLVAGAVYTDQNAQDAIGALITNGTQSGITVTYSSTNHTLSFSVAADGAAGVATMRSLGTGATQAASGTDARLSDTRVPTDGSVTNAKVATNAAISADKLADGTTNGVYTLAERSKLSGIAAGATANSTDAQLRDRSTHTGTQSADTIVDGTTNKAYTATEKTKLAGVATGATNYTDTNARANRLDQFATPAASVSFGGYTQTNVGTPVNGTDGANKAYVDTVAAGFDPKASVRVATTANITLSGTQTIDTIAVAVGDRVLVKNQTDATQNGIYLVASGAWTRATDANSSTNLTTGARTFVEDGSVNKSQNWVLITTGTITIGTTAQVWSQDSGASVLTAGAGLSNNGNVYNVGQGTGIVVSADSIGIDTTVVSRVATFTLGDGSATAYTLTHNFNKRFVHVEVMLNSGNYDTVEADITRPSVNTVVVTFATPPAANAYAAVVTG